MTSERRSKKIPAVGLLAVAALAVSDFPRQDKEPVFRTGVDLVALDVCVLGRDGRLISRLLQEEFLVLEDGVPQHVSVFSPSGDVPLAAVMLVDRSHSMYGDKLRHAKEAAVAFIRAMGDDDRVGVLTFNQRAERVVSLGADLSDAAAAIDDIPSAIGATGLYEAVLIGLQELAQFQQATEDEYRYALIILSDGEDTTGRLVFEEVLREIRRSDVIVYGVSLRRDDDPRGRGAGYILGQMALDTGGRTVVARSVERLTPIFAEIGAELRHFYRLGYVSSNERRDGRWREVSVRVSARDAHVRSRQGYYAPRSAGG